MPFIKQQTDFCGPAALASVMAYYGLRLEQQAIAEKTYTRELRGALISDLEDFARGQGFSTRLAAGSLPELKNLIDGKQPVIALVDQGCWSWSRPHYLVVFGYNDSGLIAHTGGEERKIIPYARFEKEWRKIGNAYLLISR